MVRSYAMIAVILGGFLGALALLFLLSGAISVLRTPPAENPTVVAPANKARHELHSTNRSGGNGGEHNPRAPQ